jgi:hypothetical protein
MPEGILFVSLTSGLFGRRKTVVSTDSICLALARLCVPGKGLCGSDAWQGSFSPSVRTIDRKKEQFSDRTIVFRTTALGLLRGVGGPK